MFARSVSVRLKLNNLAEFTRAIEIETLPLLRKRKGFQDEITFAAPGGREAVVISLGDEKENAEADHRHTYAAELKTLEKVIEGTPQIRTYEVCNSTLHNRAAPAAA